MKINPISFTSYNFNQVKRSKNNGFNNNLGPLTHDVVSFELSTTQILDALNIKYDVDKDGLLIIEKYNQPSEKFRFSDFGIDENKLFEDIKEIKGYADFRWSNVTDLGKLESIGGGANFMCSKLESLGNLKEIKGEAVFNDSKITDLGDLRYIGEGAYFSRSHIKSLKNLQQINRCAIFCDSEVTDLGKLHTISGLANFSNSQITDLGGLEYINGDAYFSHSKITPENLSDSNIKVIDGMIYCYDSLLKPEDFIHIATGDSEVRKIQEECWG